jgi:hypothetical protein
VIMMVNCGKVIYDYLEVGFLFLSSIVLYLTGSVMQVRP